MEQGRRQAVWTGIVWAVLVTTLFVCSGCNNGSGAGNERGSGAGRRWVEVSPESVGLDRAPLVRFAERVKGSGCIVRAGRMVFKWGHVDHPFDVSSAVKPVYTHLVLMAIDAGKIPGLDSPVAGFVPELKQLNARLGHKDGRITWRHLVTQTSCYGVEEAPGEAFDYNDYQVALLIDTLVFDVYETGYHEVDSRILGPSLADIIQCEDGPTMNSERSHPGRLRISPRDFARFGLLYLHGGRWKGRQVLEPDTVRMVLGSPHGPDLPRTAQEPSEMLANQRSIGSGANQEEHMNSYSYAWWVNNLLDSGVRLIPVAPPDTFLAQGHAGHDALIVIPSLDVIVCWMEAFPRSPAGRFFIDGRWRVNGALGELSEAFPEWNPSAAERSAITTQHLSRLIMKGVGS